MRPRDKQIPKTPAKTALLANAALAMAYAVTPSESYYCGLHRRDGYWSRIMPSMSPCSWSATGASHILEGTWLSCCKP